MLCASFLFELWPLSHDCAPTVRLPPVCPHCALFIKCRKCLKQQNQVGFDSKLVNPRSAQIISRLVLLLWLHARYLLLLRKKERRGLRRRREGHIIITYPYQRSTDTRSPIPEAKRRRGCLTLQYFRRTFGKRGKEEVFLHCYHTLDRPPPPWEEEGDRVALIGISPRLRFTPQLLTAFGSSVAWYSVRILKPVGKGLEHTNAENNVLVFHPRSHRGGAKHGVAGRVMGVPGEGAGKLPEDMQGARKRFERKQLLQ